MYWHRPRVYHVGIKTIRRPKYQMFLERELKRYGAYFRGWCQTFGEHENLPVGENDINWLFSEHHAGFILPPRLARRLYREVLLHPEAPPMTFRRDSVRVGSLEFALAENYEEQTIAAIGDILGASEELHVYLTSHLMYGTKARIITLSRKKPLSIIYKEIGTMFLRLDLPEAAA